MGYFWQNLLSLRLPATFRHPFVSITQSVVAPVAAVDAARDGRWDPF